LRFISKLINMLMIVSPSKDLDFNKVTLLKSNNTPILWHKSQEIIQVLSKKSSKQLQVLMDISKNIADLNVTRNKSFQIDFTNENSKPAIYAFDGDVYRGLDAYSLEQDQINYCQNNLRILSGLYGYLKPMDLIQAYRLEMGIKLTIKKSKNLYQFWGDLITDLIIAECKDMQKKSIINLASQEYWQVVNQKKINLPIINIHFREIRNGQLKFVSYTAKKTRGLMARYASINNLNHAEELKKFNLDDYSFAKNHSTEWNWFFTKNIS
jgi:cytoplasmic iron level regulating protein YaaA (DUF328/UPF0246 family)